MIGLGDGNGVQVPVHTPGGEFSRVIESAKVVRVDLQDLLGLGISPAQVIEIPEQLGIGVAIDRVLPFLRDGTLVPVLGISEVSTRSLG